MEFILTSDFQTIATEIASLVFPKTQFQVLSKEIGVGNVAITFKNPRDFSDNFRIRFYPKLKTLTVSGYSQQGIVHFNFYAENNNNCEWRNGGGSKIDRPSCVGERFEFLAKKFYPFLQEFFLGEVFDNFFISREFENAATEVATQAFPGFDFSLSYSKQRNKELYLSFRGARNIKLKTLKIPTKVPLTPESIYFNIDFRSHAKCLAIDTVWEGEQYLLFYNSIGNLSWSTLLLENINSPAKFGKEFENIAVTIYPILQEFFPG
ncbi:hypothetical protein G7B40_028105 [Aetokthonos hydrillicola Thurmond2011]|jgi:hypothetical protein|uniref:Uncharacterized protein n=1 Tax=Aetokthonos hydrillicola Thurmond2011 TaxID=2712845 RepID=A0AAP5IC14_9CYAN|nr:hypothetical protein [Aetokthonos hydrillicola]MBO3462537.1 hypothetical protein [Aetokthonos hydrillicola CCALA 1050]MBW4589824.1 hypothetical protein [Aetokthonos hydrillicola CCALA 1050]MDR9898394.1 hypothetical protein [Aetokthonos hydrillicola Thurmond2011]